MATPEPRPYTHATPEEIARVDAALEQTKGNRTHAALALGMEPQRVYNLINTNPQLRAKWRARPGEPVEADLAGELHRPPPLVSTTEEKIVLQITKEDSELQKGWKKLGFSSRERTFLAGLQATYASNLRSTMDLAYGGAAHANTKLLLALEDVAAKLEDIRNHPEKYHRTYETEYGTRESKGPDEYYKEFYDLFVSISSELRKMGDSMTKANELRLRLEKLKLAKGAQERSEAGWDTAKPAEKT
jgi:hypothetical protein